MIVLGLTGSIGMGKSATARLFSEEGVPVHEADEAVHRLYAANGVGAREVAGIAPQAIAQDGSVDREILRELLLKNPALRQKIEAFIHPLVRADREQFLADLRDQKVLFAVLDIPLLFETGGDQEVDVVLVVSAPLEMQRARILKRPGMTEEAFCEILSWQTPEAEKQAGADYLLDTGNGIEVTRSQVRAILKELSGKADFQA